jgi:hypothetical protein
MDKPDLIVWSAIFARTNLGFPMPSAAEIRLYRVSVAHGSSLKALVNLACADFLENDEHFNLFLDEARNWERKLRGKTVEYILSTWPDKREAWEGSSVDLHI